MKVFITIGFILLFIFSVFAQTQTEVIAPTTFLRKAPSSTSEKIQTFQKGDKVTFIKPQETNGWYYVSTPDGKFKGWINGNTISPLPSAAESVEQKPAPTPKPTPDVKPTPTAKPTPIVKTTLIIVPTPAPTPPKSSPTPVISPTPTPTPTEENEVLRVDTEEVSINVRVVDSKNRFVNNLTQAYFQVYEDDVLQPITSMVTTEVPTINALVIDNSRSLRTQLGKVIEAGKIIIGTNRPKDESAIVRFVSSNKIEIVQDFTPSRNALNNALDNLFVEGGQTAIIDAVYQTAKKIEQYQNSQKKEDIRLRALILVTDGDDRSSSRTEKELFELLRKSNVQIYTIGFINDLSNEEDASGINRQEKAKNFLSRLAQETGGKVYLPNSLNDLPQIAAEISGELRTQFNFIYPNQ
jgi:VWFA-related protein